MKKILALLFLFVFYCSHAQNKILSMEDAMVKNRTTLAPSSLYYLQFLKGSTDYVYLETKGQPVWMKGNSKGEKKPFLSLMQLNEKLKKAGADTLKKMPPIKFNESDEWVFTLNGSKVSWNEKNNTLKTIIDKTIHSKAIVSESNAGFVAFVDNHNLFVTDGKSTRQVTSDGSENIVYANTVHREEFGIDKGIFWSNNGKILAFYRMDQSMVNDYPIPDYSSIPAKNINIKYPMAGTKSHHVTLGVYDAVSQKLIYLNTGEPAEQYLTNIAWSPDDKRIYIAVLNREQNHLKLSCYNAETGMFEKTLFEEKDDKYVEPLHPVMFLKTNKNQFIWQSNRDGFNHLYLYDISGKLIRQLTKGNWEVTDLKGFDESGQYVFYMSTETSPLARDLYRMDLKTFKAQKITGEFGIHVTQINDDGTYVLDVFSNPVTPRSVNLINLKTGSIQNIFTADDPLKDYATGNMEVFTIQATTGEDVFCRMYKPVHFDSSKKYPVIVYWYGGPHAQLISGGYNGGSGDYWFQYLAQRGYLVFSLDPRGSDKRGKKFEQYIFRKTGDPQLEDMMNAVHFLAGTGFADTSKMGLFGWSYGGFMTINFMVKHPGIFKAAVAGGPVTNWAMYEIMYGERYMDTPTENPEGYQATNLSNYVQNLKGKLLLIHGLQDPVVVQQHSINFIKAAVDKNIQVDYMIYPGYEHNVGGKDRAHLYQKVTDYLFEHIQ